MNQFRENSPNSSKQSQSRPSQGRCANARFGIGPFLDSLRNFQRRSREGFFFRLYDETMLLLTSQSKSVTRKRAEEIRVSAKSHDETPKSVLIVDDEKNVRLTLLRALESPGMVIDTAEDADQALTKVKQNGFSVTLLDLQMPGKNGMEVLRHLREIRPDIKVIIVTGYGTIDLAIEAIRLGAFDFIQKPLIPEQIRAIVSRAVDQEKIEEDKTTEYLSLIERAKKSILNSHFVAGTEHLRRALCLMPGRPEAFNLLGNIGDIRGDRHEAQRNYRAALSLDPSYEPAIKNLQRSTSFPRKFPTIDSRGVVD